MPYLYINIVEELKAVSLFEENKDYLSFDGSIVLVRFDFGNPNILFAQFSNSKRCGKEIQKASKEFPLGR